MTYVNKSGIDTDNDSDKKNPDDDVDGGSDGNEDQYFISSLGQKESSNDKNSRMWGLSFSEKNTITNKMKKAFVVQETLLKLRK